jgi:hypothetical protein
MKPSEMLSACACCSVSRRRFLAAGCAACAGATGLLSAGSLVQTAAASESQKKTRVRIIYALSGLTTPGPDWPNVGFNFRPVIARIEAALKQGCPGIEFITSMANGPDQAKKIVEQDQAAAIDGYLVYQLNCWPAVMQTAVATGKPTLYADFQYGGSGGFLVYTSKLRRDNPSNLGFVASSNPDDLIAAVKCFEQVRDSSAASFAAATERVRRERTPAVGNFSCTPDDVKTLDPKECLAAMRRAKILAVGGGFPDIRPAITELMGIPIVNVSYEELNAAWEAADKDQVREIADRWQKTAKKIENVTRETLEKSAAMYLGQKAVLKKHDANAITINCLGGFYGGRIQAYPCMGFHELNNEGLIGACECDVRSTATMVAMTAMTGGRPGFISDPILDTSKRQIVYAHCVASNRVFGPQGPVNPFEILTHSEDRKGAAVRSVFPTGYMTTTVEFGPEQKTILFHQAKAVEAVDDDRACRSKLAAEPVGNIEKLFGEWDQWGWHRVTYYGDLKEPVYALADALGWKVLAEA